MEVQAPKGPSTRGEAAIAKVQKGFEIYTYDGKFGKVDEVLMGTEEEGGSYIGVKRGWFGRKKYLPAALIREVDPPFVTLNGHEDDIRVHMSEKRPEAFSAS